MKPKKIRKEKKRRHIHKFHFVNIVNTKQGYRYWREAQFVCEGCGLLKFVETKQEKNETKNITS